MIYVNHEGFICNQELLKGTCELEKIIADVKKEEEKFAMTLNVICLVLSLTRLPNQNRKRKAGGKMSTAQPTKRYRQKLRIQGLRQVFKIKTIKF